MKMFLKKIKKIKINKLKKIKKRERERENRDSQILGFTEALGQGTNLFPETGGRLCEEGRLESQLAAQAREERSESHC